MSLEKVKKIKNNIRDEKLFIIKNQFLILGGCHDLILCLLCCCTLTVALRIQWY